MVERGEAYIKREGLAESVPKSWELRREGTHFSVSLESIVQCEVGPCDKHESWLNGTSLSYNVMCDGRMRCRAKCVKVRQQRASKADRRVRPLTSVFRLAC